MDIAKLIFESIDKIFNKSQNEVVKIEESENVDVISDIKYSKSKTAKLLDCYYDRRVIADKNPVVFYIHGGGFVAGGKEYRKALSTWYAINGFFVVNADYGLSPECKFPKQIEHLISALNWIKNNAEKYNLDLDKIVFAGDSAGAYFAAMVACVCVNSDLQQKFKVKTDLRPCATILNCGIYDVMSILDKKIILGLNTKIFESYTGIKKEEIDKYKYKEVCSPISIIDKDFPPTFLIYAEKDVFCAGQAELLVKKFDELDIYFESYHSTSMFANHCFSLEWKSVPAQQANILQENFLQ